MQYIINNNGPLKGEIIASGAKNSALGLIIATTLTKETVVLENIPNIVDIQNLLKIMELLGSKFEFKNNILIINNENLKPETLINYDLVSSMRASSYLLGAFLGRFGMANIALPGGCKLGARPIDLHIKGFQLLGAEISLYDGNIIAKSNKLKGTDIFLDFPSVGATINLILASVLASGKTIIKNAAKEPHIVDVANLLREMGAKIKGAGTNTIIIEGVKSLHGATYETIPDQIEIGTYMIATAMTKGDIYIKNTTNKHLNCITYKLMEMGVTVEYIGDNVVHVSNDGKLLATNVRTLAYPGFPTDLQPQISMALGLADGTSIVEESIFENRFIYAGEALRMGAKMRVFSNSNIIQGIPIYKGAIVNTPDLRGGAALVLAGLVSNKETIVRNNELIKRGYENFDEKLRSLGANIIDIK